MSNGQQNSPPISNAKRQKVNQPPAGQEDTDEDECTKASKINQLLGMATSWLFSLVSHLLLAFALAFWLLPLASEREIAFTSGTTESGAWEDSLEIELDSLDVEWEEELDTAVIEIDFQDELITETAVAELPETEALNVDNLFSPEDVLAPTEVAVSSTIGSEPNEQSGLSELNGRTPDRRKQLAKKNGASAESEEAVDLALRWIVKHQLPDGGWCFDHTRGEGDFRDTPGAGVTHARIGATAMALLPLLGAGHTHLSGQHKVAVRKGIEFLKQAGLHYSTDLISYSDPRGRLYSHGLATIVLCECYAMTYDKSLEPYAQGAINFTTYAQDPKGGGWRYKPQQGGDTSAVGWQLMALKSAEISNLKTNYKTFQLANQFLDSVSNSTGSRYGYTHPASDSGSIGATSSIGLLCRMYLGWEQDHPGMVDGMESIAKQGPKTHVLIANADMYYNYYATQAMMHMYTGKPQWTRWNLKMRDFLVSTQGRHGKIKGSWHFKYNPHSRTGGRLYDTAMACMTLEVYYRFLPIYDL